ncbi:hypothetical protein ACM7T9_29345 [Pseudomonas aeruginosa]
MDFSKIVREVRMMADKLPALRFWGIWLSFLIAAAGYAAGNVPWEKVLG